MHDPMTQAFEIYGLRGMYFRWRREREYQKTGKWPQWKYYNPLLRVWHLDPETDGSDDSCGYSRPRLTKTQRDRLRGLAASEASEPWFQRLAAKRSDDPVQSECLLRGAFVMTARVLDIKITLDEATFWSVEMIHNGTDNFRSSLAFLPGWHSNSQSDRKADREYHAERLFYCLGVYILRERRRWFQHPRWHIHHWKVQIPFMQSFKRWAFTRCEVCHGRFRFHESGVSNSWDSDGPMWFRSEKLSHMDCSKAKIESAGENAVYDGMWS